MLNLNKSLGIQQILLILKRLSNKKTEYLPIAAALIQNNIIYYAAKNKEQHCEQSFAKHLYYNATIIVNMEPCPSCLFFLISNKIKKIIFGAYNLEYGACGGRFHLVKYLNLYRPPQIIGGIDHQYLHKKLKRKFKKIFIRK